MHLVDGVVEGWHGEEDRDDRESSSSGREGDEEFLHDCKPGTFLSARPSFYTRTVLVSHSPSFRTLSLIFPRSLTISVVKWAVRNKNRF